MKFIFGDCIASGKVRETQVITACVVITVIKMRDRANGRQREIVKGAVKGVTRVTVLLISHLGLLYGGVLLCRGGNNRESCFKGRYEWKPKKVFVEAMLIMDWMVSWDSSAKTRLLPQFAAAALQNWFFGKSRNFQPKTSHPCSKEKSLSKQPTKPTNSASRSRTFFFHQTF